MAKPTTVFVCSNCGNEASKWFGKCPACNEWNTCYEEKVNSKINSKSTEKKSVEPIALNKVQKQDIIRLGTGFEELDRVLRWRACKRFSYFVRRRTRYSENPH